MSYSLYSHIIHPPPKYKNWNRKDNAPNLDGINIPIPQRILSP